MCSPVTNMHNLYPRQSFHVFPSALPCTYRCGLASWAQGEEASSATLADGSSGTCSLALSLCAGWRPSLRTQAFFLPPVILQVGYMDLTLSVNVHTSMLARLLPCWYAIVMLPCCGISVSVEAWWFKTRKYHVALPSVELLASFGSLMCILLLFANTRNFVVTGVEIVMDTELDWLSRHPATSFRGGFDHS